MGIVRWDPFRDLINLQDRMNKLFEESIQRGSTGIASGLNGTWHPAVDIYETKDNFVLQAELPGLRQEDIRVEVADNTLTLRGERRLEQEVGEENYHCLERAYGSFSRVFALPGRIRKDSIKATLKEGVLQLILPKADMGQVQQIIIE